MTLKKQLFGKLWFVELLFAFSGILRDWFPVTAGLIQEMQSSSRSAGRKETSGMVDYLDYPLVVNIIGMVSMASVCQCMAGLSIKTKQLWFSIAFRGYSILLHSMMEVGVVRDWWAPVMGWIDMPTTWSRSTKRSRCHYHSSRLTFMILIWTYFTRFEPIVFWGEGNGSPLIRRISNTVS